MFAQQIFNDFKENADVTSVKNLKSNANGKPKSTGLKNATNIVPKKSIKSDSNHGTPLPTFKKNIIKDEKPTTCKKGSIVSEASEEWLERENMYIYNEPKDDYEDILPKSERIKQEEIDALFDLPPFIHGINRFADWNIDEIPKVTPKLLKGFDDFALSFSEIDEDLL